MSFVKRNDLGRFANKLYKIGTNNLANTTTELLADKGKEIAREQYKGTTISVDSIVNNNTATIIANGKQVAYLEYGTGLIGKGTYKGNLPTNGVPITGNWEYYYDSPHKVIENGKQGWYLGKIFTEGRVAGNQMFNTAKSLREYVRNGELSSNLKRKLGK